MSLAAFEGGTFTQAIAILLLAPQISLGWRRMHDIGIPGWVYPLLKFAITGIIIVSILLPSAPSLVPLLFVLSGLTIALTASISQLSPNEYGPNPNEVPA